MRLSCASATANTVYFAVALLPLLAFAALAGAVRLLLCCLCPFLFPAEGVMGVVLWMDLAMAPLERRLSRVLATCRADSASSSSSAERTPVRHQRPSGLFGAMFARSASSLLQERTLWAALTFSTASQHRKTNTLNTALRFIGVTLLAPLLLPYMLVGLALLTLHVGLSGVLLIMLPLLLLSCALVSPRRTFALTVARFRDLTHVLLWMWWPWRFPLLQHGSALDASSAGDNIALNEQRQSDDVIVAQSYRYHRDSDKLDQKLDHSGNDHRDSHMQRHGGDQLSPSSERNSGACRAVFWWGLTAFAVSLVLAGFDAYSGVQLSLALYSLWTTSSTCHIDVASRELTLALWGTIATTAVGLVLLLARLLTSLIFLTCAKHRESLTTYMATRAPFIGDDVESQGVEFHQQVEAALQVFRMLLKEGPQVVLSFVAIGVINQLQSGESSYIGLVKLLLSAVPLCVQYVGLAMQAMKAAASGPSEPGPLLSTSSSDAPLTRTTERRVLVGIGAGVVIFAGVFAAVWGTPVLLYISQSLKALGLPQTTIVTNATAQAQNATGVTVVTDSSQLSLLASRPVLPSIVGICNVNVTSLDLTTVFGTGREAGLTVIVANAPALQIITTQGTSTISLFNCPQLTTLQYVDATDYRNVTRGGITPIQFDPPSVASLDTVDVSNRVVDAAMAQWRVLAPFAAANRSITVISHVTVMTNATLPLPTRVPVAFSSLTASTSGSTTSISWSFPNLQQVNVDLTVVVDDLMVFAAPMLVSTTHNLTIALLEHRDSRVSWPTGLRLPALTSAGDVTITCFSGPSLAATPFNASDINPLADLFSNVAFIGGSLQVDTCSFDSVSMPSLVMIEGSLQFMSCSLQRINMSSLVEIKGSLLMTDMQALQSLSLPMLSHVAETVQYAVLPSLTDLVLTNLRNISEMLVLNVDALPALMLPSTLLGGSFSIYGNVALHTVQLTFADVAAPPTISIADNPQLTTIQISGAQTIAEMAVNNCTLLTFLRVDNATAISSMTLTLLPNLANTPLFPSSQPALGDVTLLSLDQITDLGVLGLGSSCTMDGDLNIASLPLVGAQSITCNLSSQTSVTLTGLPLVTSLAIEHATRLSLVTVSALANLTTLWLQNVTFFYSLSIRACPLVSNVVLHDQASIFSLYLTGTALTSFALPVADADAKMADMHLSQNELMESFVMDGVSIGATLVIVDNARLTAVSAAVLTSLSLQLLVQSNPMLSNLSLPSLAYLGFDPSSDGPTAWVTAAIDSFPNYGFQLILADTLLTAWPLMNATAWNIGLGFAVQNNVLLQSITFAHLQLVVMFPLPVQFTISNSSALSAVITPTHTEIYACTLYFGLGFYPPAGNVCYQGEYFTSVSSCSFSVGSSVVFTGEFAAGNSSLIFC